MPKGFSGNPAMVDVTIDPSSYLIKVDGPKNENRSDQEQRDRYLVRTKSTLKKKLVELKQKQPEESDSDFLDGIQINWRTSREGYGKAMSA